MKGCDIGYALAANSCEGVNRVDACTVTAFDVIAAFATSGPNLPLAKPVGFFGSERPANYFALAITQPTSDRQRFIETNPFDRRRKPDIGYAPAASSCEGVNSVDTCTVTASDVTAAFATSGPNLLLAKPVGFFGSERLANHFALAITQPTSEWRRLIEANPLGRRYRPDIGYAPAACSCERAGNVDACTVSACYVITAFAVFDPSLLLAEPTGFFGSERRLNCFTRRITQPTSDQLLLISIGGPADREDGSGAGIHRGDPAGDGLQEEHQDDGEDIGHRGDL
jgi:hypothetical protein